MNGRRKIVLHSRSGYRPELEVLVTQWIAAGVRYVGVAGVDAARVEDIIDAICVGDGENPYFMLTASNTTLDEALELAGQIDQVREWGRDGGEVVYRLDDKVHVVES